MATFQTYLSYLNKQYPSPFTGTHISLHLSRNLVREIRYNVGQQVHRLPAKQAFGQIFDPLFEH
jgi:hypothetical protein